MQMWRAGLREGGVGKSQPPATLKFGDGYRAFRPDAVVSGVARLARVLMPEATISHRAVATPQAVEEELRSRTACAGG